MQLCKGFTQGGSNADVVLADAYLKGLKDGIDWDKGYEAVVSDAEGISRHEMLDKKLHHADLVRRRAPYMVNRGTRRFNVLEGTGWV